LTNLHSLKIYRNPPLERLPDVLGNMANLRHLGADDHLSPPRLAYVRDMLARPLGVIQATFAEELTGIHPEFVLPEEDVLLRRRGSINTIEDGENYFRGDTVEYLFGRDEQGEYLDYHIAHRIWGNRHRRIRENGEIESLETVSMFHTGEEFRRVFAMLEAKGFSPSV
jgi:hypothetical protein